MNNDNNEERFDPYTGEPKQSVNHYGSENDEAEDQFDPYTGERKFNNNSSFNNNFYHEEPKKKKKNVAKVLVPILLVVVLLVGAYFGGEALIDRLGFQIVRKESTNAGTEDSQTEPTTERKTLSNQETLQSLSTGDLQILDVSDLVDLTMPSVVAVTDTLEYTSYYNSNPYYYFFNGGQQSSTEEATANGSGVIIYQDDENIYIVTNNHVVDVTSSSSSSYSVSLKSVTITFSDGATAEATIRGTNVNMDLAVVSVPLSSLQNSTLETIKVATLGNSDEVKVGEGVIVIGNALGYGQSVTTGIISAKERTVELEDVTMSLMQTDAAINPGNSGGGMFNAKGELIGINNSKTVSTNVEGMGFAIPISSAIEIIEELMNQEVIPEAEIGYIGINGSTIPDSYVQSYGYPHGVVINNIYANSPAEAAGLQYYDIIVSVDGQAISNWDEMKALINSYRAGTTVTFGIKRPEGSHFKDMEVEVTLCTLEELQNGVQKKMVQMEDTDSQENDSIIKYFVNP